MIQKKLLAALTAMTLSVLQLPHVSASAETWTPLTDTIEWQLADGTLTIRGTGEMPDFFCSAHRIRSADREFIPYDTDQLAPWYNAGYEQIEHIVVEDGITRISEMAFIGCTNALSASIPASVTTISNNAFKCCFSMQEVSFAEDIRLDYLGMDAFGYNYDLTEIDLPATLTEMSGTAFDYSGLTCLYIPENLTTINPQLFSHMKNITEFTVDPDNPAYSSLDGVLYNKARTILYRYPAAREQDAFFTPDSVQFVEGAAFAYTTGVETVYFSDNVLGFHSNLFMYSKSASLVRFPEALCSLPNQCFVACMSLRTLILPVLLENAQKGFLETETLDIYYARTQEDLEQIAGYSAFMQNGYTVHYNAAEDDLVSVDLSGDGVIDAQDAAMILSYAAYSATGLEGGLMLYQHRFANGLVLAAEQTGDGAAAADLTGDAEVDAMDAVLVLQYAAAVGAGYNQGLQAFLN